MFKFREDKNNNGAIALVLVIMITALTIISAAVVSMVNVSDLMSSYSFSEGAQTSVEIDACLEDAMFRLASSTYDSGEYYLNSVGINCYYEIDTAITNGIKYVTSTASTTSSLGYWQNTVVAQINVSSTPRRVESYKHSTISYNSYVSPDTTAPGAVSNLALSGATTNSINLAWTAPGDDNTTGTATTYDVRYSTASINESNWASATQATGEPSPSVASTAESMTVSGLSSGTTYYFAIKTSDEVPNTSSISNVPSLATTASGPVCGNGILETGETCDYTGSCDAFSCCLGQLGCATGRRGYAACSSNCTTCILQCGIDI